MPGTDAAMLVAESVATRVHEALAVPFHLNGTEFIATGSVGISLFPQDALDVEALMKNADSAMYQSKRQEPGGQRGVRDERRGPDGSLLTTRLRRAVERGRTGSRTTSRS